MICIRGIWGYWRQGSKWISETGDWRLEEKKEMKHVKGLGKIQLPGRGTTLLEW
jgi:hypothetical protein